MRNIKLKQQLKKQLNYISIVLSLFLLALKLNDFISCTMEEFVYNTTLVKTYRRLFSCLMFYN
ncbi:hypothetical protein AQPE_2111 [Aquipluma nitroreducens]|uniref:Uncharacterized protein n=1 Tax=Aquipluma nitroreducens TaxID=2010828 RepID=A0A5K7S8S5_9BACT|nr:hypothetical protein AQPE_2111 [Aquipluma nitroreducens]